MGLDVAQRMWTRWKITYCLEAKNVEIKNKSARVKDQFGAEHITMQHHAPISPQGSPKSSIHPVVLTFLDGYFDNLAAEATNKKVALE